MNVPVKYGEATVPVSISDAHRVDVIHPEYSTGLPDEVGAIRNALESPFNAPSLESVLEGANSVGVVFSDATRATPNGTILPVILETIENAGITRDEVTLFNATGTHRKNTRSELETLLGAEIANRYEIVQNDATDAEGFTAVGTTSTGNEIRINNRLLPCDLRILTGYIEPHFFAGYSGGGKAIMPGCAVLDTILANHGAENIDHPGATWGELDTNPIAKEVREAARMVGSSFLVNVTLNRNRAITGVFAGDLDSAHRTGCEFVANHAIRTVPRLYDLVITSNAGYPLDRNLYQTVKGMSAAARIVRPGGAILVCAECRDGIPEEGPFGRILALSPDPHEILGRIRAGEIYEQDAWQAQILCRIAARADIYLFSGRLSDEEISRAHCRPVQDIDDTIAEILSRAGSDVSVCVLPEGPETIPKLTCPEDCGFTQHGTSVTRNR